MVPLTVRVEPPLGVGGGSLRSKDYKRFWGFSKDYKQKENFREFLKILEENLRF